MTPRPYQQEALEAIAAHRRLKRSALVVMATGLGKAVVAALLAQREPGRVVVMAHLDELILQLADKIQAVTGEPPAIEKGKDYADEGGFARAKVVVTSVQTMSRPNRRRRFDPSEFSLLITDEAHHAVGKSYRAVEGHFLANPNCHHVGFTATPRRSDELALGQVYETVAYRMGIQTAYESGWLVPVSQRVFVVEGLDFSAVKTLAGDFAAEDLEAILTADGPLYGMARPTVETAGDEPTIVFCCSVKHAFLASKVLNALKPQSAEFLAGESSYAQLGLPPIGPEQRRELVARYKAGGFQFLCLCQIGLEGFDAPVTRNVAMWRATKSLLLYEQMLGRGTRPAEAIAGRLGDIATAAERRALIAASGKPAMRVFDFRGNAGRHRIVDAADLLGGKWGEPVRAHARQNHQNEGGGAPLEESLERASAEVALLNYLERHRELRRQVAANVDVAYRSHEVNPFGPGGSSVHQAAPAEPRELASDRQVRYLVRLGMEEARARAMTRKQAGFWIGKLQREGMAHAS